MADIFDEVAPAKAAGDIFDQVADPKADTPERSTYDKARFAAVKAIAQTVADIGTAEKTLDDIGPLPNSWRSYHRAQQLADRDPDFMNLNRIGVDNPGLPALRTGREAFRRGLMKPGEKMEAAGRSAAAGAAALEEETPGSETVAKAGELVGGLIPYLVTGPGAPVLGGMQSYGSTYNQAFEYYRAQGKSDEEARKAASEAATKAGLTTADTFLLLPGVGKSAAERMLSKHLEQASPIVRVAINTLAAGAQGSTVMAADTLLREAQAKHSYDPTKSWGDVLNDTAKNALVGFAATAATHLPGAAVHEVIAARQAKPAAGDIFDQVAPEESEFADAPVPETRETVKAQLSWLKDGKRKAVLVTPGEETPAAPAGTKIHDTEAGRFVYNPDQTTPAEIDAHVKADTIGDLLGYGIRSRPAADQPAATVVVRGPGGLEKQAVVTDPQNVLSVVEAATKMADPQDTVQIENPTRVIAERGAIARATAKPEGETRTDINGVPVPRVPAEEIATRPELMQFKRMDDAETGVNAGDKLAGSWDDYKAGNLMLWEPTNPSEYGLKPGQKYIVANGHHRFEFGERQGVPEYNAQILREADGYSAQDARSMAAEVNIADGKGTIYDQVKFLRNESAAHGSDAAMARAKLTGAKGRQASAIAFQAGPDLYSSFVNEQLRPEQAEAIAHAAPVDGSAEISAGSEGQVNLGLQRLGIRKAIDGASAGEISNLIQAVKLEARSVPAEQFDLFAADDSALKTAEELAKMASRIQGELSREIRATDNAAKAATTAKAKGLKFERTPDEILAENAQLKGERERWNNWALHPDLVAQVRGYTQMGRQATMPRRASSASVSSTPFESRSAQVADPLVLQDRVAGSQDSSRPLPGEGSTTRTTSPSGINVGGTETANLSSKALTTRKVVQPWNDVNEIMAKAPEAHKQLGDYLKALKKAVVGVDVKLGPIKLMEGLQRKLQSRQPNQVADYVRARIYVDSPLALAKVHKILLKAGPQDVEEFLVAGKHGYRGVHYSVQVPNGLSVELQVIPKPVAEVSKEQHRVYKEIQKYEHRNDLESQEYNEFLRRRAQGREQFRKAFENWMDRGRAEVRQLEHEVSDPAMAGARDRLLPDLELAKAIQKGLGDRMVDYLARLQADPDWVARQKQIEQQPFNREQLVAEQAVRAEQVVKRDPIGDWLDRAIEATRPDLARVSEGVTGAPIWLSKAAINGALQVVKLAYKGSKNLTAAIGAGIEHLRSLNLQGFNESEAKAWLEDNILERATGLKLQASPYISQETKDAVSEYLYKRLPMVTAEQAATDLVQRVGVDEAETLVRTRPAEIPGGVWSKLLGQVTSQLAEHEQAARSAGDTATADELVGRQQKLWDDVLPKITDDAQRLAALADVVKMSPEAQIARTKADVERAGDEEMGRRAGELQVAQTAIEQGRRDGVEAVRTDRVVNEAARDAVNDAIKNDPEIRRGIIMELAEPWAQSEAITNAAREHVRSKAEELLNKAPKPPQLRPSQHLAQIMGDLTKRAADIFTGHMQGAEPGVPLVDKLQQRLGLSRQTAAALAKTYSVAWNKKLEVAAAKLDERIAMQRARQIRREAEAQTDPLVDQAIRTKLQQWSIRLGHVYRMATADRAGIGSSLAHAIVQTSGLTGEKATALEATIARRFDALVSEGQRKALEAIAGRTGQEISKPVRSAFDKLVELDRLGGFTNEAMRETVRKALKFPTFTQEHAAELRRLIRKAQATPEGFLRDRETAKIFTFTEKLKGELTWRDVPIGIFYANLISGFTTPVKIVLENTNLLAGNTLVELLGHPVRNVLHPVDFVRSTAQAYGRGAVTGALQAQGTLKSGVISGIYEQPKSPTVLEMQPFGEKWEPLNFWKYFGRVIGTSHETTFKPAWEMKQTWLATELARTQGLRGRPLQQRVADLLAKTPAAIADAQAQATRELGAIGETSKTDFARRVREIIEQRREENMPGSTEIARDFALRTAYLNRPYGFLGLVADGVRGTLELARKKFPVLGTASKSQIPFTTIVANILNEKLNWSPVGLLRAGLSHRTGELYGRPILASSERAELYTKAIVGTIAVGALAELYGHKIHGNGPAAPEKRKELQAGGWIPHSIEYNGRYYSYMNTPAAVSLAVIGNYFDWSRYGKGADADGVARASFVTKATVNAIVSQGMLDSVKRLFEALGSESTTEGGDKLQKLAARTGAAFVVPNLVQQVDRVFDPTIYDQSGVGSLLQSQVPFVRRMNKPVLNVLGEPVQSEPFHYWTKKQSEDPVWRFIADKQAFIPEPRKDTIVGFKQLGADHYRAITADEYYDMIEWSGPRIRATIERNLDKLNAMPADRAQSFVRRVAGIYHDAAKARLR